jgi:hypothetical protein
LTDVPSDHKLSPCILKQILQELVVYSESGSMTPSELELIKDTLKLHSTISRRDPRLLSAQSYIQWLVIQYIQGPVCKQSVIEVLAKENKIMILRGLLRPLTTNFLREYESI